MFEATHYPVVTFRELRKKTAPAGLKDGKKGRASWTVARQVEMGPFRRLRMKRLRHVDCGIKDHKDRASWSEMGGDGSLKGIKD